MPLSLKVLDEQATEAPHTGAYNELAKRGTYLCRRCGLGLFRGASQFGSHCGWPSFDDEIQLAVLEKADVDGRRVEIICARCQGHLGHVFSGEDFTPNNKRHCVNSAAIDFVEDNQVLDTGEVIIAGGCFWGIEHLMRSVSGVVKAESGFTGGLTQAPSYQQVCHGNSGHYEAVRIVYDVAKVDSLSIYKHFFEIHDPTDGRGQGPDIGPQYASAAFYYNAQQHEEASGLVEQLQQQGLKMVTKLLPVDVFWPADASHQNYYTKHNKAPYCHAWTKRFD